MKPRNISTSWAQAALGIGIFGMLSQLGIVTVLGVPGAVPGTPGVPGGLPGIPTGSTNTPTIPGSIPAPGGATGINPVTGAPTLPTGIPGGMGILTNTPPMIPGGLPGVTPPNIDPVTGVPISGGSLTNNLSGTNTGNSNVSTNAQPVITPEMMQEALRIFIRESKTIQREARIGNPRQQHNLAVLYTLGIGVPLDFKRAHHWFNKAALQGLPESQFNLAIAYQGGMGVRKDMVIAYKFYSLAATQGLPFAAQGRDHLAQFMSRVQIETAQRMARGFQQGIARWQEMKGLEEAGQSNVNRILGINLNPNDSDGD